MKKASQGVDRIAIGWINSLPLGNVRLLYKEPADTSLCISENCEAFWLVSYGVVQGRGEENTCLKSTQVTSMQRPECATAVTSNDLEMSRPIDGKGSERNCG